MRVTNNNNNNDLKKNSSRTNFLRSFSLDLPNLRSIRDIGDVYKFISDPVINTGKQIEPVSTPEWV